MGGTGAAPARHCAAGKPEARVPGGRDAGYFAGAAGGVAGGGAALVSAARSVL